MIILPSNQDGATTWENTTALTFDHHVQQLMAILHTCKETHETLFRREEGSLTLHDRKSMHHSFYHLRIERVDQQLYGTMLADISDSFRGYINQSLHLPQFSSTPTH